MSVLASMTVDINALQHNFSRVRDFAPTSQIVSMIKANAYGHGLIRVAKALPNSNAFGVARLTSAELLRKAEVTQPILLMSGFLSQDELLRAALLNCDLVIHQINQIEQLEKTRLSKPIIVWLKIDTGMHRLGILPEEVEVCYQRLRQCRQVKKIILITHFSDADDVNNTKTQEQIEIFHQATNYLDCEKSLANSGGIVDFPASHANWVRPGLMLYGASPAGGYIGSDFNLKPVMTLESKIIATHHRHKGDAIGYGSAWCCPKGMPIGIVSIGYGDGYPRHAPSGTPTMINGHECPLVGRVSMDMIAVDLRSYPGAKVGERVVLWGSELPVERVAECAGTISYELLCNVARRVEGAE